MPRVSHKQQHIRRLQSLQLSAMKHSRLLKLLGVSSVASEELVQCCRVLTIRARNNRYLGRGCYRKRTPKWEIYLNTDHRDSITDTEFLFYFRVTRQCFWSMVNLIKDHEVFQRVNSDSRGALPKPAEHQLLVLLRYYGTEGNACTSVAIGGFFGIASGAVDNCRESALAALLSLEPQTCFWPDEEERKQIAQRIKDKWLFPHCVGFIDGTLLPLASRPLIHGENYLSRKKFYAVVMLVVCDDVGRILYYHVGWPGSVHDNRVWRNCSLFRKCGDRFSPKQYLLGDTAFTASSIMVPPFKSTPGCELPQGRSTFNTLLAKPRVKSEHCIGIFKGRFPFFRCIRLKLGNKLHMRRIIDHVRGGVVLHNLLLEDECDPSWIDADSCLDDLEPEAATGTNNAPDYSRRDELYCYLSELEDSPLM